MAGDLKSWERKLQEVIRDGEAQEIFTWQKKVAQKKAQIEDEILGKTAKDYDYQEGQIKDATGNVVYQYPAGEEAIRWRLWNRTGGGLMAELGSHQLDAASIFISAVHGGEKQYPLNVSAMANRPLFAADRDVNDHVCCIFEFPAPGYIAGDPIHGRKKIGVQYASINGNGYGGYGEIVYGTKGTLILEGEKEVMLFQEEAASKIKTSSSEGPALDTTATGEMQAAAVAATVDVSRGYAEELEHWAWCIRNPAKENRPRCHPKVALTDAVIALTTNIAAEQGRRIEFKKEWFQVEANETPENPKNDKNLWPDPARYKS